MSLPSGLTRQFFTYPTPTHPSPTRSDAAHPHSRHAEIASDTPRPLMRFPHFDLAQCKLSTHYSLLLYSLFLYSPPSQTPSSKPHNAPSRSQTSLPYRNSPRRLTPRRSRTRATTPRWHSRRLRFHRQTIPPRADGNADEILFFDFDSLHLPIDPPVCLRAERQTPMNATRTHPTTRLSTHAREFTLWIREASPRNHFSEDRFREARPRR